MTAATDAVTVPGAPVPAGWTAGTWMIDPAHTTAGFAVRHLMSRVRGTFSEVSGQIVTDPDPSRSTATATIALSSVGHDERDVHLRSADEAWANAAKHYDEEQLAALVSLIALINAANRLAVITRQAGGGYQPGQFG